MKKIYLLLMVAVMSLGFVSSQMMILMELLSSRLMRLIVTILTSGC